MDVEPVVLRGADLAVAATLVIGGLLAWRWSRAVGGLMVAAAVAWLLADWWELALFWHRALLVHLVLAYPAWRAPNRTADAVVAVAYVVCVLFPAALLDDRVTTVFGVVLMAAAWWSARTIGVRARHQRHRALAAAACFGGVMVATGTAGWVTAAPVGDAALLAYEAAVVAVSVILVTGLQPPSPDRVAGLVIELGDTPADGLRDAVARATHDPDVRVGFWDDHAQSYLGPDGATVDPGRDADRAAIVVEDEVGPCCMVLLDPVLARDAEVREAVEAAGRVVALNARRTVAVAERVRELQQSQRRLVEAADDERAALGAELRAGLLPGIVGLAGDVGRLRDRLSSPHLPRAVEHLERTAVDLADVAGGLRPRDLERGLGPALARLAHSLPLRASVNGNAGLLPSGVELTVWYFCSEALTNTVKHAHATRADVDLTRSGGRLRVSVTDDGVGGAEMRATGGLAGLRDRVRTYGGHLEVTSGLAGTTLAVELPLDGQQPVDEPHSTRTHSRANWKSGNG